MNPYLIQGPALISFSGGRTSAYMLWHILEAHGGKLPDDVIVAFANTGKEREETLRFVHECETRWNVRVHWLEWRPPAIKPRRFEIVGYNSANRDGHWFAALIDTVNILPNTRARYCTKELKMRTLKRFMRSLGHKNYLNVVGLRADEMHRVLRLHDNAEHSRSAAPMADVGAKEGDVRAFWRAQPFDLQLRSYQGNCDLCFLKRRSSLRRIVREDPSIADWWIRQEGKKAARSNGESGNLFRDGVPVETIRRDALTQPLFSIFEEIDEDDAEEECGLTCGADEITPDELVKQAEALAAMVRKAGNK